MKKNIKVSVCVPVYNGGKYLEETLSSIQSQTHTNIEILIQDNASTDKTSEIISSLVLKDNRVFVERNFKLVSMAANWNKVVSRASGDFVLLLSADDLIKPDFLISCLGAFDKETNFVSTEHLLLSDKKTKKRKIVVKKGRRNLSYQEILLLNPFSINFTLFKKSFLDSVLLPSNRLFREPFYTCDYDLWIRISLLNATFHFIDKPLAVYRVHNDSLSSNKLKMIKHTILVLSSNSKDLNFKQKLIYKLTLIRLLFRLLLLWVKSRLLNKRLNYFALRKLFN